MALQDKKSLFSSYEKIKFTRKVNVKAYRKTFVFGVFTLVLQLFAILLQSQFLNNVQVKSEIDGIMFLSLIVAIVTSQILCFLFLKSKTTSRFETERSISNIMLDQFDETNYYSDVEYDSFLSLYNNDLEMIISRTFEIPFNIIMNLFNIVISLIFMVRISFILTFVSLGWSILMLLINLKLSNTLVQLQKNVYEYIELFQTELLKNIRNKKEVKIFRLELFLHNTKKSLADLLCVSQRFQNFNVLLGSTIEFMDLIFVVILIFVMSVTTSQSIMIGTVILFQSQSKNYFSCLIDLYYNRNHLKISNDNIIRVDAFFKNVQYNRNSNIIDIMKISTRNVVLTHYKSYIEVADIDIVSGKYIINTNNGSGKTTFVETLLGINKCYTGNVYINDTLKDKREQILNSAYYIPQTTSIDINNESHGQHRLNLINEIYKTEKSLIIIDEPFNYIDAINRNRIIQKINGGIYEGKIIIMILHETDAFIQQHLYNFIAIDFLLEE